MKMFRNSKRVLSALMALALCAGLLAGCTGSSGGGAAAPAQTQAAGGGAAAPAQTQAAGGGAAAPAAAPAKDTLVVGLPSEPTTCDSVTATERITFFPVYPIHDSLIGYNGDELVPRVAESWTVSDDGLEYNFKIREGIKFHRGQDLTVDDVVFTVEKLMELDQMNFGALEKVEKVDDHNMKITLKYPFNPILYQLANPRAGIVNKADWLADGDQHGRNPNGTGPFKFESWVSGDTISLVRNDDYWRGPAPLKSIKFKIMSQESTELVALEAGEIDCYVQPTQANRQLIEGNPDLVFYEVPGTIVVTMGFNNGPRPDGKESIFENNQALREAFCYAINKEDLSIAATEGSAPPIETPYPAFVAAWPADFKGIQYDPEMAKQKLAEAGYPNGIDVTMRVRASSIYAVPGPILQNQLSKVGINLKIEELEHGVYLEEVYNGFNYDVTIYAMSADYPDADHAGFRRMYSGNIKPGMNWMQINNPELDDVIMTNRTSTDAAVRAQCTLKMAEIMRDNAYMLPLYCPTQTLAHHKGIKGVNMRSDLVTDFYEWSWE